MSLRSLPTQTILGLEEAENTLSADPKVQKEEQQQQERQRWHSKAKVGGEGTQGRGGRRRDLTTSSRAPEDPTKSNSGGTDQVQVLRELHRQDWHQAPLQILP